MNERLSFLAFFSVPIALIGLYAITRMMLSSYLSEEWQCRLRAAFLVLLGIMAMTFYLHIREGVYVDQRGAIVAVATLFGGTWVGFTTAIAEIIYRIYLGGVATSAGVLGIIGNLLVSLLVLRYLRHIFGEMSLIGGRSLLYLGVAVGATEALSLLLIPPAEVGSEIFQSYGLTVFLMQLLSTALLGGLLHFEESRMSSLLLVEEQRDALRRSLHQVVGSLSAAMSQRDPSTAGHEQSVADLAVAVGKELGWDEDRLEGLHLAAMVHDIGQIQIPAEILTRPRKLNPQEFELIKMHVESGYQILKEVDFPWPIAEIIYQHHENLDGTGYPRGLSGEQILPEARIIRVCDALEAMMSHRPFRRAYTLPKALVELEAESGSKLEPKIVEICVRLFNEQGYNFHREKAGVKQ